MSGGSNRLIGLTRVLRLIRLLETIRRPLSLYDLANLNHVTTRTIRRDLKLIEAVGGTVDWRHEDDQGHRSTICGLRWERDIIAREVTQ